jgi:hypothetical protein
MIQVVVHQSLMGWRQRQENFDSNDEGADNTHKMYSEREEDGVTTTGHGYKTF